MIILQRKRIIFIVLAAFVSIFSYLLGASSIYKTVETVSLPASRKSSSIRCRAPDGEDQGASSSDGITEARNKFKNYIKSTKIVRTERM